MHNGKHVLNVLRFLSLAAPLVVLAGCHVEGRSSRAESLLSQLAPSIRLGEPLADARRVLPGIPVRHVSDSANLRTPVPGTTPTLTALIVSPEPDANQHAAPDAAVEGVAFVMSPAAADRLRQQVATVFRSPGAQACAVRSGQSVDSIVVWDLDIRGGALLTFPERRPSGETPTSRLFVYTGAWTPREGLAGYRAMACNKPA
jgi:hypothetical protein